MESQTSTKQFDKILGGNQELPDYVNIMKATQSRAREITRSLNQMTSTKNLKLVFQQLPKHLRRRTMSHNVKRLPHKLRESHQRQMEKSGLPLKTKRPSRKWRRKPENLLQDYIRRQRSNIWLETHIWHAKRFHMTEKWGYKLAEQSCDKTYRTCYRASTKYCLLQDISYYGCIELIGDQNVLIDGFKAMTDSSTGLSIGAKAYLNSQREGTITFYSIGKFPFGAIGEVKFLWRPPENNIRSIWLWAHAAYYNEVLENVIQVFKLFKCDTITDISNIMDYHNSETNIGVKVLKNQFNRFRLTGPLSHKILQNALKLPTCKNKTNWFDNYLNSDENRQLFFDQCMYWIALKNIMTPSEIDPTIIINLVITDPRYSFPAKRTKLKLFDVNEFENLPKLCPSLKHGKIWNSDIRDVLSKVKISTSKFLKSRDMLLTPEEIVPDEACAIPIMLIQQPGVKDDFNRLGTKSFFFF